MQKKIFKNIKNINWLNECMFDRISKSMRAIWKRSVFYPDIAIILGTGLGNLTEHVKIEAIIPYPEIPYFPKPTVAGHNGRLVLGTKTIASKINQKIKEYADEFVFCHECGKPDTDIKKDPVKTVRKALDEAGEAFCDIVIVDTAGRLQTKVNLMRELEKIRKVIDRQLNDFHI